MTPAQAYKGPSVQFFFVKVIQLDIKILYKILYEEKLQAKHTQHWLLLE